MNLQKLGLRRTLAEGCVLHVLVNPYINSPALLSKLSFYVPHSDVSSTRSFKIFCKKKKHHATSERARFSRCQPEGEHFMRRVNELPCRNFPYISVISCCTI